VHIWFYDTDMKVQSEMIADRAVRNRKTGYMEAFGDVIVYNEKGEKLETEHLIWDEQKQKIISNTKVVITKKTQIIKGDGLISDQNFLDYEIKNPVGQFFIDNEDEK
jgi:LPS export ABC transporter protein LptC